MTVNLETLELTAEERERCRDIVRKLAYLKWSDAGRPESLALDWWLPAEREWIQNCYVPNRDLSIAQ